MKRPALNTHRARKSHLYVKLNLKPRVYEILCECNRCVSLPGLTQRAVSVLNNKRALQQTRHYTFRFLDLYYRPGLMHVGRIYTSRCFGTCNTLYPLKTMACPLKRVGIMSV
jgi:hypothetical protein